MVAVERVAVVLDAYTACALWSSTDENEEPLDANHDSDDISDELRVQMLRDVDDFLSLIEREGIDTSGWSDEQIGHDFWLTRNRHGAGFWDRGQGATGDKLTELAHAYAEVYLYVVGGQVYA